MFCTLYNKETTKTNFIKSIHYHCGIKCFYKDNNNLTIYCSLHRDNFNNGNKQRVPFCSNKKCKTKHLHQSIQTKRSERLRMIMVYRKNSK